MLQWVGADRGVWLRVEAKSDTLWGVGTLCAAIFGGVDGGKIVVAPEVIHSILQSAGHVFCGREHQVFCRRVVLPLLMVHCHLFGFPNSWVSETRPHMNPETVGHTRRCVCHAINARRGITDE
jgi:hypothetical protein